MLTSVCLASIESMIRDISLHGASIFGNTIESEIDESYKHTKIDYIKLNRNRNRNSHLSTYIKLNRN